MTITASSVASEGKQGQPPRRVVVLGATGSVGRSTAVVLSRHPDRFEVVALAGGSDVAALATTAKVLRAGFVALADPDGYASLKDALARTGIEVAAGPDAVVEAATRASDVVVAAIAGTAGVRSTHAALKAGRTVALANKETLICAGGPVMRTVKATGATVLPLDSEHNAIFQALGGASASSIERMVLTASGGPFRTWDSARIANATVAEALKHPNWEMGPKVTIDSASLMNKGLELIEAHYLFGVAAEQLDIVVHPQSVVHGLVTFADGSVAAVMALPDMRVPITHCLAYPDRIESGARKLDLAAIGTLTFEEPDLARFPALQLAKDALMTGRGLATVLNAANEIVVEGFLRGRLRFGQMAGLVDRVCQAALADGTAREADSVEDALTIDEITRERTALLIA
jgi:1-deoxy-D-xylulose-5-phosphate reductoisomerase